jgi:hypothetical protein
MKAGKQAIFVIFLARKSHIPGTCMPCHSERRTEADRRFKAQNFLGVVQHTT